ncbi:MAG: hypothetical protein KIT42_02745 [Rhodocyclaceae bacterium]|nr:hypothetical protein [Rhodocyclaceae bacterium]MCP5297373.1 hypothetical protein [Zoogloeaceae bacterium]MCW5594772.1 hypothetical protein [Rhodocyclaceae bacterium]
MRCPDRNNPALLPVAGALALFVAAGAPGASAADFAPMGSVGILSFKVTAKAAGQVKGKGGADWDRQEWQMDNSGQLAIRLKALEPNLDDSRDNMGKAGAVKEAYDKTFSEKDQEIQEKWEDKIDACDGNEACENRVRGQMLSDPQYQRMIRKAQGAGPDIMASAKAVDLQPRIQMWVTDAQEASPARGSVQVNLAEKTYGVIDTAGGGKVDISCQWTGKLDIAPGSPDSKVGAELRVNTRTSTFEIRIPANRFGAATKESCSDSKTGSHGPSKNTRKVPLIGQVPARGAANFDQVLTFKGKLGSVRSPQLRGKETLTTDLGDANNPAASRPVKVTIEWQFAAGGR